MATMMKCGHAANAKLKVEDGEVDACAICAPKPESYTAAPVAPDLAGRTAVCGCGESRPSSTSLAFFEFLGEGSRQARESCKNCGYHEIAHEKKQRGESRNTHICDEFVPKGPALTDRFYCGCRGWD